MDFFDEDDPHDDPPPRGEPREPARSGRAAAPAGPGGGHPHGGPPATKGQARARQAGLLLGAIVILVLIVIAFRGCLDARKDRSYQNYVSDLSSITAENEQLSTNFFNRLEGKDEGSTGDIGFEGEVNGDKGTSQALLDRAEGLDAPDDIKGAQEQVVLSFELRHDALEGIAAQLSGLSAGGEEADKAGKAIYTQMKVLSASDILYARAQDQIEQALVDNEVTVDEGVPDSQFLPDEPNYLDPAVTADALGGVSTGSSSTVSDTACKNDGETHGLGLVDGSTLLQPSGTALVNGGTRNRRQRRQRDRGRRPEPGHRRRERHQRRRHRRQRHQRVRDDRRNRRRRDADGEDPAGARAEGRAKARRSTSRWRPSAASRSPTTTRRATRSPSDRSSRRYLTCRPCGTSTRPWESSRSPPRASPFSRSCSA